MIFSRVFLITIVSMFLSYAHANPLLCESLFVSNTDAISDSSVEILGIERGRDDDDFFILKRRPGFDSWASRHAPHGYDPQGNAISGFKVLGDKLAEVIGYKIWDSARHGRVVLAPTPKTLSRRIAKFNRYLKTRGMKPIAISFFPQSQATQESFLQHWADGRSLPVAMNMSNHTIHDISFHYQNILLPPEMAKLLQELAILSQEWLRFNQLTPHESPVAESNIRMLDFFSTTANFPADDVPRKKLADNVSIFLRINPPAYTTMAPFISSEYSQIFVTDLQKSSSFTLFARALDAANERRDEKTQQMFFDRMRDAHPKFGITLAARGLDSAERIHQLYVDHARQLREAAADYLDQN